MKKLFRRLGVALTALVIGAGSVSADTSLLSSSYGWEKVTSLSDVSNYFYVIVDNTNDLMIGIDGTQVKYQTSADPASNLNKIWALEANGSSYGIRNLSSTKLLVQTEWQAGYNINLNDQPNVCEWTNLNFAYANGVWTIENGKYPYESETASDSSPYPGYLGPWDGAGHEANGQRIAGNKNKANWGTFQIYRITRSRFLSLYIAAHTKPVDVSFYVAGLTNSTSNWTRNYSGFDKNYQAQRANNKNTDSYSNWGYLESWNNGVTFTGTLTATLNNLPDGLYDIGAYCFKETGDVVSFTAGSQSASLGNTDNKYQYVSVSKEEVAWEGTDANKKTIGLNITGGTWLGITDVRLTYYGSVQLSDVAIALPANGDMNAGQWYYVDIAVAANNYKATATTLADVVYTTDGTVLRKEDSNVTAQFTATNNNLSATRYYIKSTTANNLKIEAASYTYTVGSATVDYAYVQGGETVTVTYADATTNDSGATFAKNGNPSVMFGNTAVEVQVSGNSFTFTVPSGLTAGTDYTLSIPAEAFGYAAGSTYNAAQNITIKTPAVFDGTYFLKNSATDQYLARGNDYGTRAYVNDWGNPLKIQTDADGYSTIQFYDNDRYLFKAGSWDAYADQTTLDDNARWTFVLSNGKYLLHNKNEADGKYLKLNSGESNLYTDGTDEAQIVKWIVEDPSDGSHLTQMQKVKDAQAATAAAAAGLSNVTTISELESAISGWTTVSVIEPAASVTTSGESWNSYYEWGTKALREATTVTLQSGLYKLTMQALGRPASNAKTFALHQVKADQTQAYVYLGSAQTLLASGFSVEQTAITDNCYQGADGYYYPNGQASARAFFNAGNYTNTVWVYIAEAGDYTYGIQTFGNSKGGLDQWTCWTDNTISLTLYTDNYWPVFQNAMTTYAPYSDVAEADDATGYTTQYATYQTYTESTPTTTLREAVTYMQTNYPTYQWANASITHPVDVTEGIIKDADCSKNDNWTGSGRTFANTADANGVTRNVFSANFDGGNRNQTITIPSAGAYLLRSTVKGTKSGSYITVSISGETNTTSGVTNGWVSNDIYFATTTANEEETIRLEFSNANDDQRPAYCCGVQLLYIGQKADFVKDGVHKYIGTYATAPAIELTDAVPVANTTAATMSNASVTFTNPNGLVFANSGQFAANTKNVVVAGTCTTLQLADGHPFVNPTQFTATNAKYTLTNGASDAVSSYYATMMIPFASTPSNDVTAYALNQGVNIYSGVVSGTATTQIAANSPVLVKSSSSLTNKQFTATGATVPVAAAGATFTNGELVGTYTAIQAPVGSYVMQVHETRLAFYIVGSARPTVNPFRAYIKSQGSGAKSLTVVFDDVNGIDNLTPNSSPIGEGSVYSVGGARQNDLKKGVNIVRMSDGSVRKVIVK